MCFMTNTCFGYLEITDAKNDCHQHQTMHFTLLPSENYGLFVNHLKEGNIQVFS